MSKLVINGGKRLFGETKVSGAKNSVLPILAATILNGGVNTVHNCPRISDVDITIDILRSLGCKVKREGSSIIVDSSGVDDLRIDEELMRQMRSSIIFLGAIISRLGRAVVSMPGGCEIGRRPIDLHLKALRRLGVEIVENHGYIYCSACKLHGARIHLEFPSVGATENIMLSAVTADGVTIITNAAREPEIADLQDFLNKMGARVCGAGTGVIKIEGVRNLYSVEHTIIPDRIVAATYLAAGAITGGEVTVLGAEAAHMNAMLHTLSDMGCKIEDRGDGITLLAPERLSPFGSIRTMPYPGFPTDIQSPYLALGAVADGTSIMHETIFENRFRAVPELNRMGANIKTEGRSAVLVGVERLLGANVVASELRGGAALVIAALAAGGKTTVTGVEYIDRGYENIEKNLSELGADISRRD